MCPTCGLPLAHSFSPQAEREREFILTQIERGKTRSRSSRRWWRSSGRRSWPSRTRARAASTSPPSWSRSAVVGGGLVAIWLALARWRRRERGDGEPAAELNAADSARLEHDLSRYDP